MKCDKSMGLINNYLNFALPQSIRKGNRKTVSNCLYSVKQYNGNAHTEINLIRDLKIIHKWYHLGLHAAWLVNKVNVLVVEMFANRPR
jgi:hypothetical protein